MHIDLQIAAYLVEVLIVNYLTWHCVKSEELRAWVY